MNEYNYSEIYQWNIISGNLEYNIVENVKAGFIFNGNIRNAVTEEKIPMNLGTVSFYNQGQNSLIDTQVQGYLTFSDHFANERLTVDATAFVERRDYSYKDISAFTRDGIF